MENSFLKELWEALYKTYTDSGVPVKRILGVADGGTADGTRGLRFLFVLPKEGLKGRKTGYPGEDERTVGIPVVMEVLSFSMEDAEIIQFFSYIHDHLTDEQYQALRPILDMDNMMRAFGHYGLFPKSGEEGAVLYYKQQIVLRHDEGVAHAAELFGDATDMLFLMLSESVYGLLEQIGERPDEVKAKEIREEQIPPMEQEMRPQMGAGPAFCTNCGAKLAPGARFCMGCGAKI